jgi:hypothetical protein
LYKLTLSLVINFKAIELCTNRFDEDTKTSFVDLYTKVDAGATADQIIESQRQAEVCGSISNGFQ